MQTGPRPAPADLHSLLSPYDFVMRLSLRILACLLLAACAHAPTPPAAAPTVVLVSVDGLRPADVTAARMPALDALADANVRAEGMRPSYPSLTFPNHYALVTGRRPDHSGIVHNIMRDPRLGTFRASNRAAVQNGAWWEGATPVWVDAQRAGLRTATMFWPGSEAAIHGVRPWRWREYRGETTAAASVAQVLAWLSAPPRARPRFVTVYLGAVDAASHEYGPDSAQADAARREVDAAIAALRDGLRARGQLDATNLLIVSDHGFETVPPGHVLQTEAMVPPEVAELVSDGQVIGFAPRPGRTADAERALLGRHAQYQCWRKQALPPRWHYGSHPRIPAIVCQMDAGWDALGPRRRGHAMQRPPDQDHGSHGFDPDLPSMRATFIAAGPAFAHGVRLPVFDNVDVYPLLMRLLRLPPEANDGEIAPLLPALKMDR